MMLKDHLPAFLGLLLLSSCGPSETTAPQPAAQARSEATPVPKPTSESKPIVASKPAAETESVEKETRTSTGQNAPGFQLTDQNGQEHTLKELLQNEKVALVFYRSADW